MKSKKHDDIEEMIDLIEVEPSDKPDYQGALDRLKSIDLDYAARKLSPKQLENVSDYSIHDYPRLEMMGDIETLQKLIDNTVNQQYNNKTSDEMFKEIGLEAWVGNEDNQELYDDEQNEELNTYASFNKVRFINSNKSNYFKFRNEIEIFFYPDEGFDFDKFIAAVKKRMEEKGWL